MVDQFPRILGLRLRVGRRDILAGALSLALIGCRDKEKELSAKLGPAFDELMPLTERDSKQVRDGLPQAATVIVKHLDDDPGSDVEGVKRALSKSREEVKDLAFSKITFYAFASPKGVVLRSEAETDLAAGNSLSDAIPETKKLFGDGAAQVETYGYMQGLRGVNNGNELQWILGAPVKGQDGKALGAVVAGWSLRLYARYLEENLKTHLEKQNQDKALPLAYVFIVKANKAYGGPDAPDVNAAALGDLDLASKVKDTPFETTHEVEGRRFLIAARKAPALGDDVIVAIMMSAI
jgi:hypothetical protein